MKRRLCCLDIDGVVNTLMIYKHPTRSKNGSRERDGYYFDLCWPEDKRVSNEQAIVCLDKLCHDYKLDIVITSTWMIGHSLKEVSECLYNSGLSEDIKIIDYTSQNYSCTRGWNIEAWLNKNKLKVSDVAMVIIDDDSDMTAMTIDFTLGYLAQCKTHVGFSNYEYAKACEILDRQLEECQES